MKFDHAFIISYPHAGATLVQQALNSVPGVCIRGENGGILEKLAQVAGDLVRVKHLTRDEAAPGSPLYGVSDIKAMAFIDQIFDGFSQYVLAPPQGTRLAGFAETRHLMPYPQLVAYCNALRQRFPNALLIFTTRSSDEVMAASHASGSPLDDPEALNCVVSQFNTYAAAHPDRCIVLRHEDFARDPNALAPLFERLDLPFEGGPASIGTDAAAAAQSGIQNAPAPGRIENGVVAGKDGWLFLWTGSNEVNRYYTEPDFFTEQDAQGWVELLNTRRDRLAALGADYRHLTVPDKLSLYPDKVSLPMPHHDRQPARQVAKRMPGDGLNVDILPDLLRAAETGPTFYKTDSHWNSHGCQTAYRRLCAALNVAPRDFSDRPTGHRELVMDLGNKFTPHVIEDAAFTPVQRDARRVTENEMVRYNETTGLEQGKPRFVGCYVHLRNDSPEARPETVMLFGDSFSEFRPHLLMAMLAETYRDMHFVWSTNLDYDLIARIRPQIVITEIAERFMGTRPTDKFTVPME